MFVDIVKLNCFFILSFPTYNIVTFFKLGTEYIYNYETKISVKTGGQHEDGLEWFDMDEKLIDDNVFSSASDTFKVASTVKVVKVWTGNHNSLIRFKVNNFYY